MIEAARSVIEASQDFPFPASKDGDARHPQEEQKREDGAPVLEETTTQQPAPDSDALQHATAVSSEAPDQLAANLAEGWTEAKKLVSTLGEELAAGLVPAQIATTFAALERLATRAAQAQHSVGADLPIPNLLTALGEVAKHAQRAAELRSLGQLIGPDARLKELTTLTEALAKASSWNEEEQRHAEAIIALHRLVDLVAREGGVPADKTEFNALAERANVLPGNLSFLAATGQLTLHIEPRHAPPQTEFTAATDENPASKVSDTDDPCVESAAPLGDPVASTGNSATEPEIEATSVKTSAPAPPAQETNGRQHSVDWLADLVAERRFAAAHAMADVLARSTAERWTYRVAALGEAVRSANGSCAAKLTAELRRTTMIEPEPVPLLVAVPALIRAGLITSASDIGALLIESVTHLDNELGAIAEKVGRTVVSGALAEAPLVGVLADVTELERRLANAKAEASSRLNQQRTLRFPRATAMAKLWLEPDKGLLGSLLSAAATDDRRELQRVKDEVSRLSTASEVNREIDRLDQQLRLNGAKPLVGSPRQSLHTLATGALSTVSVWLEAVAALELQARQDRAWAVQAIGALRSDVLDRRSAVVAALMVHTDSSDPLTAAAAHAAVTTMEDTFALLAGERRLTPGEPSAALVLSVEWLKVSGARFDSESGEITLDDVTAYEAPVLAEAFALTWEEAYARHLADENYPAAAAIMNLAARKQVVPGGPTSDQKFAESQLQSAVKRSRSELLELRDSLAVEMRRARGQNELSEQEDTELTSILTAADPIRGDRMDLHEVRRRLGEIKQLLPELRSAAAERLRERLDRAVAERQNPADPAECAKISDLIDAGKLSIAEELIYCLANDADLPAWEPREDLEAFFPAVPNALPHGITADHIEELRSGGLIAGLPVLDCANLSEGDRERGAKALRDWRLLASTPPDGRGRGGQLEHLIGVLRLAGLEPVEIKRMPQHPGNGSERRFVEASGIRFVGRATLPEFGTRIGDGRREGGTLKILLAWGRPTADLLMSWIDHDRSGDSLLVAYFGTMTAAVRHALAIRTIYSPAPVIVLDDAALAYLAVRGEGQLSTALAVTLPFSAINPYVRDKRGPVDPEMFYGRDQERRAILDPKGTQVIFGGRGLGKSALLRDSKTQWERTPGRMAIFLELRDIVGKDGLGADAVWDKLRKQLTQDRVLAPPRAKAALGDAHDAVKAGLRSWLDADSRHRLLILLDEADGFFESDMPKFVETGRLKELGTDFEGRVKVVFAGLHSVQRFAKIGRNNPFSHLAQRPVVIGPLAHQHAFDLIAKPLRALGMVIETDLVHRINGYCAYQPFLLQMFGHRLIELMHQRRLGHDAGPPYVIKEADVEAVISDHGLKGDIIRVFRDTLNLDSRYNVIANVLAHHAYERGMDARLTERDLRAECGLYWAQGFAGLDFEGFRTYLQEMAGLGVLDHNNEGLWQLRSVTVLPMIGNPDDVQAELVNASTEQIPHRDHVLQARRLLQGGRTRSPLTEGQIDDLLGEHTNQTRVVLGSRATGIGEVSRTLDEVIENLGLRFRLKKPTGVNDFKAELVEGVPGDRRIVISDLARKKTKPDGCRDSLRYALTLLPRQPGVTRSAVLIADPSVISFWEDALTTDDERMSVVLLRRHTRSTLKTWTLETERFGAHLDELFGATSGWPHLVERALTECFRRPEPEVLTRIAAELATPQGNRNLLDAVGLLTNRKLSLAYDSVIAFIDEGGLTHADLVTAVGYGIDEPTCEPIVQCLLALDLFDVDAQGRYHPEPLVAAAWLGRSSTPGVS
ncbi:hypothetical protein [Nonomuraea fuscirosea]|uniref:hypothetical protein n=1 Tax=Nonomuraea fuscirosea TaxID=1291556 RepID=UPI0034396A7B